MSDRTVRESFDFRDSMSRRGSVSEDKLHNSTIHLEPSRWWFFSSVFPMIVGTFGPVASAYSICALVRPWRQHLVPGGEVQDAPSIPDPQWLTIANAVQLGVAIISNMFLLFNMARRVRFSVAQPVTIVGWYISSICLIALVSTASGPLREDLPFPEDELIWSQAYYYGIWAAILYFVCSSLMVITFWGASSGHYEKDFVLTINQRTLMLQTIMLLLYIHLGAGVFSSIEHWNYLDGVYWANVTLFTIGFGDIAPQNNLGKALLIPYAVIGIISLGLLINAVRNLTLEGGRRQIAARMEEKRRRRAVRSLTSRGQDDILEPIREEDTTKTDKVPATEFDRRKIEFNIMRKIQAESLNRRRWMSIIVSTGLWLILWLAGAVFFEYAERPYQGWNYFDGFYFCFTAWTTIGYGDITPVSPAGRSFFVFWSLLALPTMTVLISHTGEAVVGFVRDFTIRLGNITILPGEDSFVSELKYIINRMTFGRAFPNALRSPSQVFSERTRSINSIAEIVIRNDHPHPRVVPNSGHPLNHPVPERNDQEAPPPLRPRTLTFSQKIRKGLPHLRNPHRHLPTGPDFHFLLISEIRAIAKHLKEPKPHKYSYEEWAWYLKLIGEDEHKSQTHSKAHPKEKHGDADHPDRAGTWSWVGHRNPLLGSQEETEWILERLTDRLEEVLFEESRRRWQAEIRAGHRFKPFELDTDEEVEEIRKMAAGGKERAEA